MRLKSDITQDDFILVTEGAKMTDSRATMATQNSSLMCRHQYVVADEIFDAALRGTVMRLEEVEGRVAPPPDVPASPPNLRVEAMKETSCEQ